VTMTTVAIDVDLEKVPSHSSLDAWRFVLVFPEYDAPSVGNLFPTLRINIVTFYLKV